MSTGSGSSSSPENRNSSVKSDGWEDGGWTEDGPIASSDDREGEATSSTLGSRVVTRGDGVPRSWSINFRVSPRR